MSKSTDTTTATENESLQFQPGRLTPLQRGLSLAELVVGGAIVIGHNVYRVIPNEVPILFVLGLISLRLRGGSWAATGLRWPASWRRTLLFALAAAALRILLGGLIIEPVTAHFWPPDLDTTTRARPASWTRAWRDSFWEQLLSCRNATYGFAFWRTASLILSEWSLRFLDGIFKTVGPFWYRGWLPEKSRV